MNVGDLFTHFKHKLTITPYFIPIIFLRVLSSKYLMTTFKTNYAGGIKNSLSYIPFTVLYIHFTTYDWWKCWKSERNIWIDLTDHWITALCLFRRSRHALSYWEEGTCVQESESAGADSRVQVLETDRKYSSRGWAAWRREMRSYTCNDSWVAYNCLVHRRQRCQFWPIFWQI